MRYATFFGILLVLSFTGTGAVAQEIRVSTENDIIGGSPTPDDLYTYSLGFKVEGRHFSGLFQENAFTDKAAGVRFDETYVTLGRAVAVPRPWGLDAEVGVVHVGRGLFGERVQNAVHGAIGCDKVHLRYISSSVHPRVAVTAYRRNSAGERLIWGPRVRIDLAPGLRSWLLVSAQAAWRPTAGLVVEALAGERFTKAFLAALAPHVAARAPAARLGFVVAGHFFVSWSYNDYGDQREHVSAGYRIAVGSGARMPWATN